MATANSSSAKAKQIHDFDIAGYLAGEQTVRDDDLDFASPLNKTARLQALNRMVMVSGQFVRLWSSEPANTYYTDGYQSSLPRTVCIGFRMANWYQLRAQL